MIFDRFDHITNHAFFCWSQLDMPVMSVRTCSGVRTCQNEICDGTKMHPLARTGGVKTRAYLIRVMMDGLYGSLAVVVGEVADQSSLATRLQRTSNWQRGVWMTVDWSTDVDRMGGNDNDSGRRKRSKADVVVTAAVRLRVCRWPACVLRLDLLRQSTDELLQHTALLIWRPRFNTVAPVLPFPRSDRAGLVHLVARVDRLARSPLTRSRRQTTTSSGSQRRVICAVVTSVRMSVAGIFRFR